MCSPRPLPKTCRSSFDGWGRSGDYLRIDFGHVTQNAIRIKNIRIRPRNSHEQAEFEDQAAGACWMWKKVSVLDGIDAVFKPYLSVIGISDWSEIHHGIN